MLCNFIMHLESHAAQLRSWAVGVFSVGWRMLSSFVHGLRLRGACRPRINRDCAIIKCIYLPYRRHRSSKKGWEMGIDVIPVEE